MSVVQAEERLRLPESLQTQLHDFRRRVWSIKLIEGICATAFGITIAYLILFGLDRVWETPNWARALLFVGIALAVANLGLAGYRWVWRHRRADQLAKLLARSSPILGDQLLGVIELVENEFEQSRSRALCQAAIEQVAEESARRDFRAAVPNPHHRLWTGLASVPAIAVVGLLIAFPTASGNVWARLLAPWKSTPRYTFAAIEPIPDTLVIPHGEAVTIAATLKSSAIWKPALGTVQLGSQQPVSASRSKEQRYDFEIPPQLDPTSLNLRIGDTIRHIQVEPTLRPELTSVVAKVALPDYLGLTGIREKDVRGGQIALVKGSRARFAAAASRPLGSAEIDGKSVSPQGAIVSTDSASVDGARKIEFRWTDELGLTGKEPFVLSVNSKDDDPPSLSCEDLPRQKVLLDLEQLAFKVRAQDDFGIKRIGLEWKGLDESGTLVKTPAKGETILAAGDHDKDALEANGTFSAKALGIEPQPIAVRVFAEDYLPGRPRVYSPPHTFYVLNAEQHAIWLTEQLSKWHRQALEVRDREMQLSETNKQLRGLPTPELDQPENRRKVEAQALAERANGRRLSGLVMSGEDLVRQATRNPEFGVGHLERWAEMLQILKDISGNRMPSVADLLKEAASAPSVASASQQNPKTRTAGNNRASKGGTGSESKKASSNKSAVPAVADMESSQNSPDEKGGTKKPSNSPPKSPRLTLPVTTVMGKPSETKPNDSPAAQKIDEAITKQQDLLAEFDKIADELNRVLANLEGSTLVKRLKAASRSQYKIAGKLGDQLSDTFGVAEAKLAETPGKVIEDLSKQEAKGSQDVSFIMDDLQAYFERRRYAKFKTVLEEMRKLDPIGALRQIGDDMSKENGLSIAQCEYWSDTLDRWAEDLVDPACKGECPGSKSKSSLPPSLVLEAMLILEGEINLREETRVAQQARAALAAPDYLKRGQGLGDTQKGLRNRTNTLIKNVRELPDGEAEFAKEIKLLSAVSNVMTEAASILKAPETGPTAIAAETEAIELLLQSKRINPKGGGGGGDSPGGGGTGTTNDAAIALLGNGVNEKEVREDRGVSQSTGESGPALPEEFRSGLDEYFNRLEREPSTK